uniref:Uncharacterized protein n=1 Tax=Oryza sativa subsp. japonica TaxID=39947 RepID=Q67WC4_ORYSJ|nr:hypothetical protein [Oryza sativa Japonica Group]BAD37545.1 hypothetical protein [Oryza sativa Japonica Group]
MATGTGASYHWGRAVQLGVKEDVVHRLKLLSAKGAGRVAIDATLLEEISRPTALLKCKPKKEFAFSRALRVPEKIGTSKEVLAKEERLIRS